MGRSRTTAALAVWGITAALLTCSSCAATQATSNAGPKGSASAAGSLVIVGLGDSIQTSTDDVGRTFLDVYGQHLHARTGAKVEVRNLADGSNTTKAVLDSLQPGTAAASAVAAAHLVVITVGGNDADPFGHYPSGTCAPRSLPVDCLNAYAPGLKANLTKILARVDDLKPRHADVVITSPDFNPFVGWSEAPTDTFGVDFYRQVASAETALVCRLARERHAKCLDFLHLFNGARASADAAPYLSADHAHPGPRGVATIADALAELVDR